MSKPDRLTLDHALALAHAERQRRCRADFHAFYEWVIRDERGRPSRQSAIHRAMNLHVEFCWRRGIYPAFLGPIEHGKCETASTRVQMADGSLERLGDLVGRTVRVLAFVEADGCYRPATARAFSNGRRRVLKITLRSGREKEVTDEHPFWAMLGWRRAADLRVGDHVALAGTLPEMGRESMRPGEAAMLGYLVGNGGTTKRVHFSATDEEFQARFEAVAMGLGLEVRRLPRRTKGIDSRVNGARAFARAHGLLGKGSWTKRVPRAIFVAPNRDVAAFLAAYFECDGSVSSNRSGVAEFYSVNRDLLLDVQSLLLRFGVRARLAMKRGRYDGRPHVSWRLTITGKDALSAFREHVPVRGAKRRLLDQIEIGGVRTGSGDCVPTECLGLLEWPRSRHGLDHVPRHGFARPTVRRAALAEGNRRLLLQTSDSIAWDRVVAVEDLGERDTYGLEVDGHHTYVSDDVVVHNTMQLVVGRPSWELGNDVQLRIKLISANDPMAMKRVTTITSVLRSAAYREVFPHVQFVTQRTARRTGKKAKETQHEITINREGHSNDPSVEATGILMPGSGGRADLEIFDDVVEQRNAIDHPAERVKVIQNFEDVWMTRLGPTARPLFVGQPWHEQDLTHRIMRSRGWCTLLARIAEDCSRIDLEVFNPPADYPIPERLAEHPAFEDQGRDARMRVA